MQAVNTVGLRTGYRVESIDLLRGVVMIIMALDHVRDYFHWSAMIYSPTDLTYTTVPIFFTRWITHFCAPIFVFLSGTSAYLIVIRKGKTTLSGFLFKRGLWLILIELVIVNFGWFFNIHFTFVVLQTIWALGFSMIVLAALVHLPKQAILVISVLLISTHNLLDRVHVAGQGAEALSWALLHESNLFIFKHFALLVGYPVLPWIGVMAAGYCLGELYIKYDAEKRKKRLLYLGFGVILIFIVVRYTNTYGDPRHWSFQPKPLFTFLSFLNTAKYPPSFLYILMTIGPALIFLALTEKPMNNLARIISMYGRVPFFYYVLHIYLIHLTAMLAASLTGFNWSVMILNSFPGNIPSLHGYGFHLWVVYIVWIILVVALYPLCKWYDNYRTTNKQKWWLSYL